MLNACLCKEKELENLLHFEFEAKEAAELKSIHSQVFQLMKVTSFNYRIRHFLLKKLVISRYEMK